MLTVPRQGTAEAAKAVCKKVHAETPVLPNGRVNY